jgi:L-iditol 2-dehydrogenase
MIETKAVLIGANAREVSFGSLLIPELGPHDVLIASRVVGICRSDIELRDGHLEHILEIDYPIVPGHEWSGQVADVGSAVTRFAAGDRVVGECLITSFDWFGCNVNGAGSELFTAPEQVLHKLPDGVDDVMGALVEPFTIAFRAIREVGRCDSGDVVAIIGGGMVGQCAAAICRANGAVTVMIEPKELRRAKALELGADFGIDPTQIDDLEAWFLKNTGVPGPNLVIEASGAPAGLALALDVATFETRVVMIGITSVTPIAAPLNAIQAKNLTVTGVTGSPKVWPAALRFLERAGIDLRGLVTATFTFEQATEAFAAVENPENMKVHLVPGGAS